jgi:SSS family solute:Na+ symporter
MMVAMFVAKPLLGNFDQAFQYIQEFTGFFTPGIVAIFLLGIMSPRVTANGALTAAIGSAVFSLLGRWLLPEIPFMDRVSIVFLLCVASALLVSREGYSKSEDSRLYDRSLFDSQTSAGFNLSSCLVVLIVGSFYVIWW